MSGNGNTNDVFILDEIFLRGLQATNNDAIALFDIIFAGYYTSRVTHIYTIRHMNAAL